MVKGTVKFFNKNSHYGFIDGEDGKSYFVHESGLKQGADITEGDQVSFKGSEGDKGPKAEEVEKLGSNEESAEDSEETESEDEEFEEVEPEEEAEELDQAA